jgi:hypothetical protein
MGPLDSIGLKSAVQQQSYPFLPDRNELLCLMPAMMNRSVLNKDVVVEDLLKSQRKSRQDEIVIQCINMSERDKECELVLCMNISPTIYM